VAGDYGTISAIGLLAGALSGLMAGLWLPTKLSDRLLQQKDQQCAETIADKEREMKERLQEAAQQLADERAEKKFYRAGMYEALTLGQTAKQAIVAVKPSLAETGPLAETRAVRRRAAKAGEVGAKLRGSASPPRQQGAG
jgi:ADP-ribosylglycohydrolase